MPELEEETRPTVNEPLPKWDVNGVDMMLFVALFFACIVVGASIGEQIGRAFTLPQAEGASPPLLVPLARNIGMQLGMAAAYLGFRALSQRGQRDRTSAPEAEAAPEQLSGFLIGAKWLILGYVAIVLLQLITTPLLVRLGYQPIDQEPVLMVQQGGSLLEKILLYATILVIAPICEELVFRGAIFRYLHRRQRLWISVTVSGLVFALVHGNLFAFASLAALGAVLALAYRETGRLRTCIGMHAAFNAISLIAILATAETPP